VVCIRHAVDVSTRLSRILGRAARVVKENRQVSLEGKYIDVPVLNERER